MAMAPNKKIRYCSNHVVNNVMHNVSVSWQVKVALEKMDFQKEILDTFTAMRLDRKIPVTLLF